MTIKEATGVVLKRIRRSRQFTIQEICDRMGHNKSWLSYIENGKQAIFWSDMQELARIYDVSLDYISDEVDKLL